MTPQKILLTGGSGFLGRHLVSRLQQSFSLRVLDVTPVPASADVEVILGSVADTALVEKAVAGVDALVIAHMAPNRDDNYASVDLPFTVNVQGTAALLQAASRQGIRRVVLISSITVVDGARTKGTFLTTDLPLSPNGLYSLTKALQEETARFYHRKHDMEIAVLRPSYVITEDPLEDKYGRQLNEVNWHAIDPRDIAEATALALVKPGITFDIFYTLAGPGAAEHADLTNIHNFLGWQPKHRFDRYPACN